MTFTNNGLFNENVNVLKIQGNRAIFSLFKKARRNHLPIELQFDLFDKTVIPIILYGAEVWGYKNSKKLETLHHRFCKLFFRLKPSTPNIMVYRESGRYNSEYYAKKSMINFWGRIACGNKNKVLHYV